MNTDLKAEGTCFNITADDVTLDLAGFNITGDGSGIDYGVYVNRYNRTTIKGGSIYNFTWGIMLSNNKHNNITNMTLNANLDSGAYLSNSMNNSLTNNTLNLNTYGVYIEESSNNSINENINNLNSAYGLYIYGGRNNLISNNSMNFNQYGFVMSSGQNALIQYNLLNSNSQSGIYFNQSSDNAVSRNNIWNCSTEDDYACITLEFADNNAILDNIINLSEDYGIYIDGDNNNISGDSSNSERADVYVKGNNNRVNGSFYSDVGIETIGNLTLYGDVRCTGTCVNVTAEGVVVNGSSYRMIGSGTDYGIYTLGYNNLVIKNFGNIGNFTYGIYFDRVNDSLILNNTMISEVAQTTYAMYLMDSDSNTVENNTINWNATGAGKNSFGVHLYINIGGNHGSNNITRNDLKIFSASSAGYGFYLFSDGTSNSNIIQSNTIDVDAPSGSGYGAFFSSFDNALSMDSTILQHNTIDVNATTGYGVYLYSSDPDVINSNTIYNETINVYSSNSASAFRSYGVYFWRAESNNLTSLTINATAPNAYAADVYLASGSDHNVIYDNTLQATNWSAYIDNSGGTNNTFTNVSYSGGEFVGTSAELIRKWYYKAYVNNSGGYAVANASVLAYNVSNSLRKNLTTNGSGWTDTIALTEYVNYNSTRSYYNNYSMIARKGRYSDANKSLNHTDNLLNHNLQFPNSAPTIPNFLSPANNSVHLYTFLNITLNSTDLENQTITYYTRIQNDSALSGILLEINGTSNYISANETWPGNVTYITARAYDGQNFSNWSTAIITDIVQARFNFTLPANASIFYPAQTMNIQIEERNRTDWINDMDVKVGGDGLNQTYSMTNAGTTWTYVYTVPTNLLPSVLTIEGKGTNNTDEYLNNTIQVYVTRPIGQSVWGPTIKYFYPTYKNVDMNNTINISVMAKGDTVLNSLTVTVMRPNGTNQTLAPIQAHHNLKNYSIQNNYTYTPPNNGTYKVTADVIDINDQVDQEIFFLNVERPKIINLTTTGFTNLSIIDSLSRTLIAKNASITVNITEGEYNLIGEVTRHDVELVNATINTSVHNVMYYGDLDESASVTDFRVLDRYEVRPNISKTYGNLTYNYTSINASITNEDNLGFYKCENTSNCNWEEINITINHANSFAIAHTDNFSVFVFGESAAASTPDSSTPATTAPTGGGGGGAITNIIQREVSFQIIPTSPLKMYSNDSIMATIMIINTGQVDFDKIDINMTPNTGDLSVRPEKKTIEDLKVNESETFRIDIDSHTDPGVYEVELTGKSNSPKYTATSKIIITLIDVSENLNKTKIVERVQFAYDFFKENPECLEFQEMIEEAEKAMDEEDYSVAAAYIEAAINACKETITSVNKPRLPELLSPKNINLLAIILGVLILTMGVWFGMEAWHRKHRLLHEKHKIGTKEKKVKRKKVKRKKIRPKARRDIWKR
jgi:parallel beta-helix repeat protein